MSVLYTSARRLGDRVSGLRSYVLIFSALNGGVRCRGFSMSEVL